MADIIAHGTAGAYVATGGYGGREATVSANLVIGSTTGSTFYDPTGYITKEASGFKLTVYHHSLRCAKLSDTWASRTFGDAIPATSEHHRKLRTDNVIMMHVERKGIVCPITGEYVRTIGPELETLGQPMPLLPLGGELMPLLPQASEARPIGLEGTGCDPCAPASTGTEQLTKLIEAVQLESLPGGFQPVAVEPEGVFPLSKGPMNIIVLTQSDQTLTT